MLGIDRRSVQNFDWVLAGVIGVLLLMGFANLVSATHASAVDGFAPEVRRQLMALGIGAVAFTLALAVDYRHLERLALPIYIGILLLLLSTLLFAPVVRGSKGWLVLGPLRLQPSELAKIGLVIALARFFHRNPPGGLQRVRDLWRPAAIAAPPVALILAQRDMGVALLTLMVAATFLPFAKIRTRAWLGMAGVAMAALAALWFFVLHAYQRSRILDFLDPARDPLASGYQVIQSRIAIGSGGLLGKGWLEGTQTQLRFLPTQHTDFIFSVLAEEWGFLGSITVLALFLFMLLWGLWIARNSKDRFGAMLAVGLVGTLFWPAAINVAMVLGLAPVIGVPLPLFSYGGSALLAALISLGLLLNISMRRYVF